MIIGIDCGCLGISDERLKVGVFRTAEALLRSLSEIDKKNTYKLYSFKPIEKEFSDSLGKNFHNVVVKPTKGWMSIWLPLELKRNPVDIFLGLSQGLPKLPIKTKGIVFIYDLTFEKYPQWFEGSLQKIRANTKNAVNKADIIIAVSKATKNDIRKIYRVPEDKIKVIYPGFDQRLTKVTSKKAHTVLSNLGIRNKFLLFAGTYKQSKNIPNILRAFSQFKITNPVYQMVLVGSNFWLDKEIPETIAKLQIQDSVKVLGFVNDTILAVLYQKAAVFVSPSYNEGFGLTHLEAANFDLPIICSKKGATEEVLGEGAIYVNPDKPREIAKAINKLITDKTLRKKLIKKAKTNTSKFSREKSGISLLKIINQYAKD